MRRKIAVCDDERSMLRQLSQYLTQIQQETGDQYDLFYYTSAEELLTHIHRDVQVILLDISMGGMSGMDCARQLRAGGCTAAIFFITSMTEYALEGYDVQAFAFLPKPLVYGDLKQRLVKYFSTLDNSSRAVLPVETAAGTEILPIDEILYAEVFQHETSFVLPERKVNSLLQLSAVESRLSSHGFFRCHRSYLVNMAHIKSIRQDSVLMPGDIVIPISKYRRKEFMDAYAAFMGGRFA